MGKCGLGSHALFVMAIANGRLPREIFSAKEAKRRFDCSRNYLGCPDDSGADRGLQCGLSGNRAAGNRPQRVVTDPWLDGNAPNAGLKGNRLTGNGRYPRGKSGPTKAVRFTLSATACES